MAISLVIEIGPYSPAWIGDSVGLFPVARGNTRKEIVVYPRERGGDNPVITRSTVRSLVGRWPSPTAASGTVRSISCLSA